MGNKHGPPSRSPIPGRSGYEGELWIDRCDYGGKSRRGGIKYYPETDSFHIPDGEDGPYDVPASQWQRHYGMGDFWKERQRQLAELEITGRISGRETDRYGRPWGGLGPGAGGRGSRHGSHHGSIHGSHHASRHGSRHEGHHGGSHHGSLLKGTQGSLHPPPFENVPRDLADGGGSLHPGSIHPSRRSSRRHSARTMTVLDDNGRPLVINNDLFDIPEIEEPASIRSGRSRHTRVSTAPRSHITY